jgi:predicted metal-dependent hydrolase
VISDFWSAVGAFKDDFDLAKFVEAFLELCTDEQSREAGLATKDNMMSVSCALAGLSGGLRVGEGLDK